MQYTVEAGRFDQCGTNMGVMHEKIGTLYGFNLYIERASVESDSSFSKAGLLANISHDNCFYVQHPYGGMKYE